MGEHPVELDRWNSAPLEKHDAYNFIRLPLKSVGVFPST